MRRDSLEKSLQKRPAAEDVIARGLLGREYYLSISALVEADAVFCSRGDCYEGGVSGWR